MSGVPRVEFLWWRQCPSWQRALDQLRAALADAGLDPQGVELIEVETEDAAERQGFIGSPTIRVDGADIEPPPAGESPALSCRIYRRADGRVSPLPDPGSLRRALTRKVTQ
jgi:hypothetical protein